MASVNLFSLMGKIAVDGVEKTTKDLQEVSKTGKDTEGKLGTSFTNIANKAGELGKKAVIGLAGIATAAVALVETTREFRQDYGKLETTFKTTNQEAGVAKETFKALFGVLGEDDTAIEASNHLAMLTNNEKDLNQWTDILTGVYATFGDSLPLEGLAEAANETMRVGQVTGPLADALNWAGVSEDAFNEKLLECSNNQEREALIRETLNGLYNEASTEYQKTNESVIANNQAQAEMNMKMAEMAEKLEPLVTKGKIFLAEVLEKIAPALHWAIDNINILAPIVLTFVSALLAMGLAGKIAAFITTIKTLKGAIAALNITMSINPTVLIVAGIVALIAIFVVLWNKCEWFRKFWIDLWEKIKQVLAPVIEWIKQAFQKAWNSIKQTWDAVKPYFEMIWKNIKAVFSVVVDVLGGYFKMAWNNIKIVWDLVVGYFKMIWNNIKAIFSVVKAVLSGDFKGAWEGIKQIWNNVKGYFQQVWNGVKGIFGNVGSFFKNSFNSAWNGIKSIFSNVGSFFSGIVNKIKSIFNFKISLPKIKLPRFSIKPSGWQMGDLLKGSIPKLGIDWYAKAMDTPMLLDKPTAFGYSSSGNIRVGGEAGDEIVGGANTIMGMIGNAVSSNNVGIEEKLDRLISLLSNYLPAMQNQQVVLSTGELVGALTSPLDKSLGQLAEDRRRGR